MTSSSTDLLAGTRPRPEHRFLTADRGSWVRLAVAVAFALAAFVAPLAGATRAQFTDSATVEVLYQIGPTSTPEPTASTPAPEPTGTSGGTGSAGAAEPTGPAPASATETSTGPGGGPEPVSRMLSRTPPRTSSGSAPGPAPATDQAARTPRAASSTPAGS